MVKFLTVLFFFAFQFSFCQSDSLKYYYNKGKIDKVIKYGEDATKISNDSLTNEIINLAYICSEKGNHIKAEIYYNQALDRIEKLNGKNTMEYAKTLNFLAISYTENNQYLKAESTYLNAIEILKNLKNGYKSKEYATFLKSLAYLHEKQSNFKNALKILLETLNVEKKISSKKSKEYATLLKNIAKLYFYSGSYKESEQYYIMSLNIIKLVFTDNHFEYASILDNLAVLYSELQLKNKAEQYYLKALEIRRKTLGEDNLDFATSLNNLGSFYSDQKDYDKAELMLLKSLEIKKNNIGEYHKDYVVTLNNLGLLYKRRLEYKKAETTYLKTLEIKKTLLGNEHSSYATTLSNLATLYLTNDSIHKVEPLLLEVLEIRKIKLGQNHPDYAQTLHNLGYYYKEVKNYSKAELMYFEALKIIENNFGVDHFNYINTLDNLAELYNQQGLFSKAEPLLINILDKKKRKVGQNHLEYATTLSKLANLYSNQYAFKKAELIYLKALEITKNGLGEKHPDYAKSVSDLAFFYFEKGDYFKSQFFYLKAYEIYKSNLNENHSNYISSLNNLGHLYHKIGALNKSEEIFLTALDIVKKRSEENGETYSNLLHNFAQLYEEKGLYDKAEAMYLNSIKIKKNNKNFDEIQLVSSLNALGVLYFKKRNFENSESYYHQSLDIIRNRFGEIHPTFAVTLDNLAILYDKKGDLKTSERLHLKTIEILEQSVGKYHSDYIIGIRNLALFYQHNNFNINEAFKYFKLSLSQFNNKLIEETIDLSENEFKLYVKNEFHIQDLSMTFLNLYPNQYLELNSFTLHTALLIKNLSLRNQQRIKNSIEKSNDVDLKEKYQKFVSNKRTLTKLEELPLAQRPSNYEPLKTENENLEKDITRQSATFADAKKKLSIGWKQIQEKLKPNEVAIDLVSYNYYNKKWTDSIMYGAFVIKKDSKFPKYINLFEEKQLKFLIERNSKDGDTIQAKILNKQYSDQAISDLFLKPLEKEFQGISSIYLSPSGLGHQIDFSALSVSETQTLGEKYQVHILGSTSEIVNYKVTHLNQKTNTELFLYGNIDYKKSDATNKVTPDSLVTKNIALTELFTRSVTTDEYRYLEGSKVEINKINALSQKNNFASTIVEDRKATEESIKAFDGRTTPFVLHLATHGFFFPDPKQELPKEDLLLDNKSKIFKMADDPMMRSGLILAGANKNLKKSSESDTIEDGILTASEISNLDLSACQLVVLSACETGLGQINGSEGVFGLQRAFKMAGVKNIIMSLWKVPDAQTAELFEIFYSECFAGKTIHEAFQTAQAKMKAKYSPYYWAGFVLLE